MFVECPYLVSYDRQMRKRNQSIIIIRFALFPITTCAPLSLKINKEIEGYYCIIESVSLRMCFGG